MQRLDESTIYLFEGFRLDIKTHRLTRSDTGEVVPLTPKIADLLIYLLENSGRVLSKDEMLEAVWQNAFVEESNLSQSIFMLRKALGETSKVPRFILTAPNRGYEFIAMVTKVDADDDILNEGILSVSSGPQVPGSESQTKDLKSKIENRKWMWLSVPLVLFISVGALWFYPKAKPAAITEIKTIAILPFANISGNVDEEYLGQGLSEVLISQLSNIKTIVVRPNRSVQKYSAASPDPKKIGNELDVEAILIGTVQKNDESIRVTVQLVRTSDGATVWAETFDDKFTNLFAVQDSISQKVVQSLALKLDEKDRERFNRKGTENAEAYQDYLLGIFFLNRRINNNLPKAVTYFERAVQKDPKFALAYAGLANAHLIMPEYAATSTLESYPLAKKYVTKSLELDNDLGEAHTILAAVNVNETGDNSEFEKALRRSIALSPNFPTAHRWLAVNLRVQGRYDESFAEFKRAREIDPTSPEIMINIAQTYKLQGNYDAAIDQLRESLSFAPDHAITHDELARVLYKKGLYAEALPESLKAVDLSNRLHTLLVTLAEVYIKLGEHEKAAGVIKELEEKDPGPASYYIAMLYSESGDKENMFVWLERAMKEKPRCLNELKDEPNFAPHRNEPRFQEMVRRVGV